jgi:hypothetical protein
MTFWADLNTESCVLASSPGAGRPGVPGRRENNRGNGHKRYRDGTYWRPCDGNPFKPSTESTFLGSRFSPGKKPAELCPESSARHIHRELRPAKAAAFLGYVLMRAMPLPVTGSPRQRLTQRNALSRSTTVSPDRDPNTRHRGSHLRPMRLRAPIPSFACTRGG